MNILTLLIENIQIIFDLIDRCQSAGIPAEVAALPAESQALWMMQNPGPVALAQLTKASLKEDGISRENMRWLQYRRLRRERLEEITDECQTSTEAERSDIYQQYLDYKQAA